MATKRSNPEGKQILTIGGAGALPRFAAETEILPCYRLLNRAGSPAPFALFRQKRCCFSCLSTKCALREGQKQQGRKQGRNRAIARVARVGGKSASRLRRDGYHRQEFLNSRQGGLDRRAHSRSLAPRDHPGQGAIDSLGRTANGSMTSTPAYGTHRGVLLSPGSKSSRIVVERAN